jgi:hypothetical protein
MLFTSGEQLSNLDLKIKETFEIIKGTRSNSILWEKIKKMDFTFLSFIASYVLKRKKGQRRIFYGLYLEFAPGLSYSDVV